MKLLNILSLSLLFVAPTLTHATANETEKPIEIGTAPLPSQKDLSPLQKALDSYAARINEGNSGKEDLALVRKEINALESAGFQMRVHPLTSNTEDEFAASLIKYGVKSNQVASSHSPHTLPIAIAACLLAAAFCLLDKPDITPPPAASFVGNMLQAIGTR